MMIWRFFKFSWIVFCYFRWPVNRVAKSVDDGLENLLEIGNNLVFVLLRQLNIVRKVVVAVGNFVGDKLGFTVEFFVEK